MMETSNATSLNSNRETALARKTHFQAIQEACLNEAQVAAMRAAASLRGKTYIAGPTAPKQGKVAAGVWALFHKDIAAFEIPDPIDDYKDAANNGRCKILCFDAGGITVACGIIYGWAGARKGSGDAARTDDLIAIVQAQFDTMDPGHKLIMGNLNGNLDFFPTAMALINEHGWTDIDDDELRCQGKPGRATCYTEDEAKESRIDFIIANNRMTPALVKCYVDESSDYPTHRPLCIKVLTKLLEFNVKELRRPTNFASMMEQRIEEELAREANKRDDEILKGNDAYEGEQEHQIRKKEP